MYTSKDFKVELVNKEQVKGFIEEHGRFASACYNTDPKYAKGVGASCLESGHFSGSRHLYFVFDLKMIPRFTIDQLVRHEQGIVKNVQSLRYCNKAGNINLYASPEIENNVEARVKFADNEYYIGLCVESLMRSLREPLGVITPVKNKERLNEICRSMIPIGVASECNFACNIEALIHLANVRLCTRAELPIRAVVEKMVKQVIEVEPRYAEFLVPNCIKNGYCIEDKCCGLMPKKGEK